MPERHNGGSNHAGSRFQILRDSGVELVADTSIENQGIEVVKSVPQSMEILGSYKKGKKHKK